MLVDEDKQALHLSKTIVKQKRRVSTILQIDSTQRMQKTFLSFFLQISGSKKEGLKSSS